ncbi:hypothetical protein EK21DRAFT_114443 [Setomelanomma holmii]|uniref:Uncharacterized protein n=1 Tax=Setomelanomma holmii TaxID=210430 RepID=A0A9P4H5A5_9PLEO|nr:hypothetical protein EK21DRAFT_114443 [Setomelanomma holmii]
MSAPAIGPSLTPDDSLSPVAEVYVAYHPPCDDDNFPWEAFHEKQPGIKDLSRWKAFKGTLRMCIQTISSKSALQIQESGYGWKSDGLSIWVKKSQTDLKWIASGTQKQGEGQFCLPEPNQGDTFCIGDSDLLQWSALLDQTWNGAGYFCEGCDDYYTGYMRTGTDESPPVKVHGTTWINQQYVAVDFVWLTFRCAIYVGSTLFYFATVIKSTKQEVPIWKSSPLILFHAADDGNGIHSLKEAEIQSKKR